MFYIQFESVLKNSLNLALNVTLDTFLKRIVGAWLVPVVRKMFDRTSVPHGGNG